MTFLHHGDVLDFNSDDVDILQPDILLEESTDINTNFLLDCPIGYPVDLSSLEPTYEIVPEQRKKEQEGLKLRLRVSNSICLGSGSVGSSPSEVTSDNEILNVEEFLNHPTEDFVTLEESKQAQYYLDPDTSPAYSSSTAPSPLHSTTHSPHQSHLSPLPSLPTPVAKRRKGTATSPVAAACARKIGQNCRIIPVERTSVEVQHVPQGTYTPYYPASSTRYSNMRNYYGKRDQLLKTREAEVLEVEKQESHNKTKQGAVIGAMERGPRMFGVRYGPCDRPIIDTKPCPVHVTLTNAKPTTSCKQPVHQAPPEKRLQLSPQQGPSGTAKRSKCPAAPKAPKSLLTDMFYQKHLYCSVDKPLFESDPEVLQLSEMYQLMLNTFLSLEAQRTTALRDIDKLENITSRVKKRPYKFIKQLQKGELVFPVRQNVAKVPELSIKYRDKVMKIGSFDAPLGQVSSKQSEEISNKTRLKTERY